MIPAAATSRNLMLLFLLGLHEGSITSPLQMGVKLHAPRLSSTESFSGPISWLKIARQRVTLQVPEELLITDNHWSIISQEDDFQHEMDNEEKEFWREASKILIPKWSLSRDLQHVENERPREIPFIRSRAEMVPWVGDEITSQLSLCAPQAVTTADCVGRISEAKSEVFKDLRLHSTVSTPQQLLNCTGGISETEYQALQDLYLATGGDNWHWHNISSGGSQWIFPSNLTAPCSDHWEGVYCSLFSDPLGPSASCSVTNLVLPLTGLRGQLPASIANLLQLKSLNIQQNRLEGSIPSSLGNLAALMGLSLNSNLLTATIPSSFGNLTALRVLDLDTNSLTGPIPSSLGNLTALTILSLDGNSLTGAIPSSLGLLTALIQLELSENSLTESIPTSLGDMTALTALSLNQNSLTGPIPFSLGNLRRVTDLYMYSNSLTWTIPSSFGNLAGLEFLYLYENSLSGAMPSSLGLITTLTDLALDSNSLEGSVPSSLGALTNLQTLFVNSNILTAPIPSSLGYLSELTELVAYVNYFTGTVPFAIGKMKALSLLFLDQNYISGVIPESLGDMSLLLTVALDVNLLSGSIPTSLAHLFNLTSLALNSNMLSGKIPSSLGSLTAMQILGLNDNSLTGEISPLLSGMSALLEISFSSNSLFGTIPSLLGSLQSCFYFNASDNSLTGPIPDELGKMGSNLPLSVTRIGAGVALDLSQNALTGTISPMLFSQQLQTIILYSNCITGSLPPDICSSSNLQTMVLDKLSSGSSCQERALGFQGTFADRTLQGSIPECIWTMPLLETLHLSGNGLHGTVGNIGSISSLIIVDASNNFLTGVIPTSLQTHNRLQQLALGNNKLSGTLSPSFVVGNLTLLRLDVNRLSGFTPSSFASMTAVQTVNVLSGNLFACGSSLPSNDPASSSYVCGSEDLDIGLYTCGATITLLLVCCGVMSVGYVRRNDARSANLNRVLHAVVALTNQYSEIVSQTPTFSKYYGMIESLYLLVCMAGGLFVMVSMPVYVILKMVLSAGILTDQYTWITTSAFLHGYTAAGVLISFVAFSTVILAIFAQRIDTLLQIRSETLHFKEPRATQWTYFMQRMLLQTLSLFVVFAVDVLYVYLLVFGGLPLSDQLVVQAVLGLFKMAWKQHYVKFAASWIVKNHDDISEGGLIFHQVVMNVLSFIVAPCLATLGTDTRCLFYALQGDPSVISNFNITLFEASCGSITISTGAARNFCITLPYQYVISIFITPAWFYSYECASALLNNYIPVLLLILTINAVVKPLMQCIVILLPERLADRLSTLPLLQKSEVQRRLTGRRLTANILLDLTILMTFGLASPLLALMIILKQITTMVRTRLLIGRYAQQADDSQAALASLEDVAQQFQGGDIVALLGFLLCVVGIFWGAMIFEMVADQYGNTAGWITWAVAFAGWTTTALLTYAYLAKIGSTTGCLSMTLNFSRQIRESSSVTNSDQRVLRQTTNEIIAKHMDGGLLNSDFDSERVNGMEII